MRHRPGPLTIGVLGTDGERKMAGYWTCETRRGVFAIVPVAGWFEVRFGDEGLGRYLSPEAALEDLVSGSTFWPSDGFDPSEIGLPDDLSDWTFNRA